MSGKDKKNRRLLCKKAVNLPICCHSCFGKGAQIENPCINAGMNMQEYRIICRDYTKTRRRIFDLSKQMVCFAVIDYLFCLERLSVLPEKTICFARGNYRCSDRELYMEQKRTVCSATWDRQNGYSLMLDCPNISPTSFTVMQTKRNASPFDSFSSECPSYCYFVNPRGCFLSIPPAVHRETGKAAAFGNTFCHFERRRIQIVTKLCIYLFSFYL